MNTDRHWRCGGDDRRQGAAPLKRGDNRVTLPATGGLGPHPFIEFPLWGLRVALDDHKLHCSACSGNAAGECVDEWYAGMLRNKIERLTRG